MDRSKMNPDIFEEIKNLTPPENLAVSKRCMISLVYGYQ